MSRHLFNRPDRQPHQTGFTLIEVLVVLIMVGMIGGLLFQALEHAYRLQERFGSELFKVQQGQMAVDWYRQTIQGLYPDQPDGPNLFHGEAKELSGLSVNPLGSEYGAPTQIRWKLRNNLQSGGSELVYVEAQRESAILTWRSTQARFVYLDDQLTVHDKWPPPLGLFAQLPRQIQLLVRDAGEPIIVIASPKSPAEAMLSPQDIVGRDSGSRASTPKQRPQIDPGFIP
jgi:prepilin-type N-terminal cleavage/methylation domain-containing protein